jgi:hypothetical protein
MERWKTDEGQMLDWMLRCRTPFESNSCLNYSTQELDFFCTP